MLSGATRQYVYDGDNLVQERNSTNGITANLLTGMGIDAAFLCTEKWAGSEGANGWD